MTTAEKLIAIAENVPKVYEAGKAAGGAVAVEEKDVNFYDYDGTCLYAYTLEEAQALTELPPLPSHDGLICQGWNWTLADLLEWNFYADVGAIYITDNGETRIYIDLKSLLNTPITLCFNQTTSHGVEVDIGNGVQTVAGTGSVSLDLTFSSVGQYVIRMKATSGTFSFDRSVFSENYANLGSITAVNLGENITELGAFSFRYARHMRSVTFPEQPIVLKESALRDSVLTAYIVSRSMTNAGFCFVYNLLYGCMSLRVVSCFSDSESYGILGNSSIRDCYGLRRFVCSSNNFNTTANYCFSGGQSIEFIHFKPNAKLSKIPPQFCYNCYALQEFNIPLNVTDIATKAFYRCYSMKRLRFYPITPPVVANADAFTDIPTTCVVEVPAESLEAYKNATNYAGIAAQMVGV